MELPLLDMIISVSAGTSWGVVAGATASPHLRRKMKTESTSNLDLVEKTKMT